MDFKAIVHSGSQCGDTIIDPKGITFPDEVPVTRASGNEAVGKASQFEFLHDGVHAAITVDDGIGLWRCAMQNRLGELADKLRQVEAEISQWFEDHVRERLAACESADEVNAIVRELSLQCQSGSGEVRDMPSSIAVALCIKMSEFV